MADKDNQIQNNVQDEAVQKFVDEKMKEVENQMKEQGNVQYDSDPGIVRFFKGIGRFFQKIIELPADAIAYLIASIKVALTYNTKAKNQGKDLGDKVKVDSSYNKNRSQVHRDRQENKERMERKDPRIEKSALTPNYNKFIDEYSQKVPNGQIFSYMRNIMNAGEKFMPDEIAKCMNYGLGKEYTVTYTKDEFTIKHDLGGVITLNNELQLVPEKTNAPANYTNFVTKSVEGLGNLNCLGAHNQLNEESKKLLTTLKLTPQEIRQHDLGMISGGQAQLNFRSVKKYLLNRDGQLDKAVALLLKADMDKNKCPSKMERLAQARDNFAKDCNTANEKRIYESEPTTAYDRYVKLCEDKGNISVDDYLEFLRKQKATISPKDFAALMDHNFGKNISIEFQPQNKCYSVFDITNATKNEQGLYVGATKFKIDLDGNVRESDLAAIKSSSKLKEVSHDMAKFMSQNRSLVDYSDIRPTFASRVQNMIDKMTGNSHEKKLQRNLDKVEKTIPVTTQEEKKDETKWVRPETAAKPEPRRSPSYEDTMILHTDISDSVLADDEISAPSQQEDKDQVIGDAELGDEGIDWDYLFNDENDNRANNNPSRDDDELDL